MADRSRLPMVTASVDFWAGAMGGALGIVLGQPLDTVRVRQQQCHAARASTLNTLWCMMRREGTWSPFKGMTHPLAGSVLQSALLFCAYSTTMQHLRGPAPNAAGLSGDSQTAAATSTTSTTSDGPARSSSQLTDIGLASTTAVCEPLASAAPQPGLDRDCVTGCGYQAAWPPLAEQMAAQHATASVVFPADDVFDPSPPGLHNVAVAGMVAGLAQSVVISPIELLKIRMQLQVAPATSPHYLRPGAMLRHVMRTEGITGLFRGTLATAYRDTPGCGMYFVTYHAVMRGLLGPTCGRQDDGRQGAMRGAGGAAGVLPEPPPAAQVLATQLLAGGLAGIGAWLFTYPADVIKTRLQSHPCCPAGRVATITTCAQGLYRSGGLAAFYKGLAPTLQRAFIVNAVTFLGYEYVLAMVAGADKS